MIPLAEPEENMNKVDEAVAKMQASQQHLEPQGTMDCPICGVGHPHAHSDGEILAWLNAQASRFGLEVEDRRVTVNGRIQKLAAQIFKALDQQVTWFPGLQDSCFATIEKCLRSGVQERARSGRGRRRTWER